MQHPFYFTTLPNYDSRLKPSGSSRWSQRFTQALGFARLDSVSLLIASYLDDFSSLQYRYVCGWNMRYNVYIHSWIQSPIFTSFAQQIRRPLCVHHDLLLAARICLHLYQRLACITKRSVVVIWFLWGFLSVCFDYNIQVLWLTSSRCWADVGGRHQPNVKATLGRHRTADIDPTSTQHMLPCSFFFTP